MNTLREGGAAHVWIVRKFGPGQTRLLHTDSAHTAQVVRATQAIAPGIRVKTMSQVVDEWTAPGRSIARLLGIACAIALISTMVSLYGWAAYEMESQRKTAALLGALGASSRAVLMFGYRRLYAQVIGGVVVGAICAAVVLRRTPQLLFGIPPLYQLAIMVGASITLMVWLATIPAMVRLLRFDYSLLRDLN